jgi:transposase
MKRKLVGEKRKHYCKYGQRWQAETAFSMIKRRQSDAVAARTYWSQCRELMLMALTHNIMILAAA